MSSEDLENRLTLLEEQFKNAYDPLQPEPDYSHLEKQIKDLQLQITILQSIVYDRVYTYSEHPAIYLPDPKYVLIYRIEFKLCGQYYPTDSSKFRERVKVNTLGIDFKKYLTKTFHQNLDNVVIKNGLKEEIKDDLPLRDQNLHIIPCLHFNILSFPIYFCDFIHKDYLYTKTVHSTTGKDILKELGITDAYIWVRKGEKLRLVHDEDDIAVSYDLYSNHVSAFIHQASEPIQVLLDNHHTLVELTIPLNTTLAEVFTKFKEITGKKIDAIDGTGYQWELAQKRFLHEHVKKYPIILKVH